MKASRTPRAAAAPSSAVRANKKVVTIPSSKSGRPTLTGPASTAGTPKSPTARREPAGSRSFVTPATLKIPTSSRRALIRNADTDIPTSSRIVLTSFVTYPIMRPYARLFRSRPEVEPPRTDEESPRVGTGCLCGADDPRFFISRVGTDFGSLHATNVRQLHWRLPRPGKLFLLDRSAGPGDLRPELQLRGTYAVQPAESLPDGILLRRQHVLRSRRVRPELDLVLAGRAADHDRSARQRNSLRLVANRQREEMPRGISFRFPFRSRQIATDPSRLANEEPSQFS